MEKVKPVIGRVGGKSRLAPWIIEHLSRFQWSIYCEPFAGSAAVYFRMVNDGIFEQIRARGHHPRIVLNDADSRIVQLFRTCRDYPELLAHAVKYTPYSREEHRLAQQETKCTQPLNCPLRQPTESLTGSAFLADCPMGTGVDCLSEPTGSGGSTFASGPADIDGIEEELEQARRYLVDGWQSTVQRHGNVWSMDKSEHKTEGAAFDGWHCWQTLPSRILTATDHLKRCYIENDDAVKVIERWATPHTAIYADPPYVGLEDYYAHNAKAGKDDSLDLHYRLASALNTVEASAVIVSYYPCELVDELYPEETWERHYRETVASSAGITRLSKTKKRPKRTELLLVRKAKGEAPKVNLSGQMGLF